jgi:hypothetical protein
VVSGGRAKTEVTSQSVKGERKMPGLAYDRLASDAGALVSRHLGIDSEST